MRSLFKYSGIKFAIFLQIRIKGYENYENKQGGSLADAGILIGIT
jgi:hypothetical protein